jgi:uncharacterized protein YkwD
MSQTRFVLYIAFAFVANLALGGQSNSSDSASNSNWQLGKVDATQGADYLMDAERQIIIEINLVRADPAEYACRYLVPLREYYKGGLLRYPGETAIETSEGRRALEECIQHLMSTKPVGMLVPKEGLTKAARDQARDQEASGKTGHTGSDGSSTILRINRYGKWERATGENIDYGNADARRIIASFLVDDGVASRGHRKNLLDPNFEAVGVAVGPHPVYRAMCVIDFAGSYK